MSVVSGKNVCPCIMARLSGLSQVRHVWRIQIRAHRDMGAMSSKLAIAFPMGTGHQLKEI